MNTTTRTIVAASVAVAASASTATVAEATLPQVNGEMKHVFIAFDGSSISTWVDDSLPGDPASQPVELIQYPGDAPYSATGGDAGVLDGRFYSARYGWLQNGFIDLDQDNDGADELSIWVKRVDATAGLDTYEGGMRGMRNMHSYAPLFATDGSDDSWRWPVSMVHNWYAADAPGAYEATYEVYIGDAAGVPLPGFASDQVTVTFNAIPAPGAAAALGVVGIAAIRRRR